MSIRTTVTLDEDVLERVKQESRTRGASFRDTLNDLVREALLKREKPERPRFKIEPFSLGPPRPGVNYDCIGELLEYAEGEDYK